MKREIKNVAASIHAKLQNNARRTTLDIDLLGLHENKVVKMETVMREICNQKVPRDGLIFDANTIKGKRIKEGADYEGVRIKFRGLRQTLWKAFLIKGQFKHAPEKLMETAIIIEKFLCEPLEAIHKKKEFDCKWKAPRLWK